MMGKSFTPFPVIKTASLTLRQLRSSDDEAIFSLRSNKQVNKYLGRKPSESIKDAQDFIRTINENAQRNDAIYWAITLGDNEKLIGTICLFGFSEDNTAAEIGYELLPDFQGKGIMHEAATKVVDFAFNYIRLSSIEAYTHSDNQESTRLLERLGFSRESIAGENLILFKLTANPRSA
ncbi:GNAT family N-acetyltransferase [Hymenobacter busanensis]|uniref:GNAT family N-acetyltransferase n=1 Tax=Hymenobacter busanensis TaxID=2607656 RepID=A0A7L4ZYG8_9BACT|nr:GNAT family N-acetyltransferase [Hymenobacter busanensis]KAA9339755.1 GNAT family N-acetyltransferase [Hymenobacter busanensis]QHJ06490.1 GNAT family N-acetyltransferase [Hymenobacter busanensis]